MTQCNCASTRTAGARGDANGVEGRGYLLGEGAHQRHAVSVPYSSRMVLIEHVGIKVLFNTGTGTVRPLVRFLVQTFFLEWFFSMGTEKHPNLFASVASPLYQRCGGAHPQYSMHSWFFQEVVRICMVRKPSSCAGATKWSKSAIVFHHIRNVHHELWPFFRWHVSSQ